MLCSCGKHNPQYVLVSPEILQTWVISLAILSIQKQLGALKTLDTNQQKHTETATPNPTNHTTFEFRGFLSGYQSSVFKDHSLRQGRMDFCPQALGLSSPGKPEKVNVLCQDVISVQGLSGDG